MVGTDKSDPPFDHFLPESVDLARADRRIDFHARAKIVSVALRIEPKIVDAEFARRPISIADIVIDQVKASRQADVHDVRMSAGACRELEELRRRSQFGSRRSAWRMSGNSIVSRRAGSRYASADDFLVFVVKTKWQVGCRKRFEQVQRHGGVNAGKPGRAALEGRDLEADDAASISRETSSRDWPGMTVP